MKDSAEILARAHECVDAELEKRKAEASKRLPVLCTHNHRQPLDTRPLVDGEPNPTYNRVTVGDQHTIGLCMLGAEAEEWPGNICEDPIDAQRCPYFTAKLTKEDILEEFRADLASPGWIAQQMPELATLLWVLEMSAAPRLSWFQRLRLRFWQIRLEPLRPTVDPALLLPGSK